MVVRRPDAVVDYEDVEATEDGDGGGDERLAVLDGGEFLLDGAAVFFAAALGDEGAGAVFGGAVAENNAGSGLAPPEYYDRIAGC